MQDIEKDLGKGLDALNEHYKKQTKVTEEHLRNLFGQLEVLRAEVKATNSNEELKQLKDEMLKLHSVMEQAMVVKEESTGGNETCELIYDELLQVETMVAKELQGVINQLFDALKCLNIVFID